MTTPIRGHTIGQQQAEAGSEHRTRSDHESKCREIEHNLLHSDLTTTTQLGFGDPNESLLVFQRDGLIFCDAGVMPRLEDTTASAARSSESSRRLSGLCRRHLRRRSRILRRSPYRQTVTKRLLPPC